MYASKYKNRVMQAQKKYRKTTTGMKCGLLYGREELVLSDKLESKKEKENILSST